MEKITNYRRAWLDYKETPGYKKSADALTKKGIQQPYADNIIQNCFAAGWRASGVKIEWDDLGTYYQTT